MHFTGTIWRPPYEADSLLLEAAAGCTHHRCKFCTLYDDLPFPYRMSPLEDMESDLAEAREALNRTGESVRRVFLTGANPFVLRPGRLTEIAGLIRRYLPEVETIGCFARVTDTADKTDRELAALGEAGYDGITIGVETGDGQALAFMDKGYRPEDILTQCRRLDRAGIRYSFFYLAGVSGAGRGEEGALATAALCNQLHPQRIGTSMLTVCPHSALWREIQQGRWQEAGELEKYRELRVLVERLDIPVVFAALGASNAVQLQGRLPEQREQLLAALDRVADALGEDRLRQYRTGLRHL